MLDGKDGVCSGTPTAFREFSLPFTVKLQGVPDGLSVKGYHRVINQYVAKTLQGLDRARAIVSEEPGAYVFTSASDDYPGVAEMPNGRIIAGLIERFGLGDYIGRGQSFDPKNAATVRMVAGVMAKIAGVPSSIDPITYLRQKGYSYTPANGYAAATNEQTLYMLMALYEIKSGTKISGYTIRNYGAISGITNLDVRYKESVHVAFDMGVGTIKDAKAAVTTADLLQLIGKLNAVIKL
jgi:hypothetical protein